MPTFKELRENHIERCTRWLDFLAITLICAATGATLSDRVILTIAIWLLAMAMVAMAWRFRKLRKREFNSLVNQIFDRAVSDMDARLSGAAQITPQELTLINNFKAERQPGWLGQLPWWVWRVAGLVFGVASVIIFVMELQARRTIPKGGVAFSCFVPIELKDGRWVVAASWADEIFKVIELDRSARQLKATSECLRTHYAAKDLMTVMTNVADPPPAAKSFLNEMAQRMAEWHERAAKVTAAIEGLTEGRKCPAVKAVKAKLPAAMRAQQIVSRALTEYREVRAEYSSLLSRQSDSQQSLDELIPLLANLVNDTYSVLVQFAGDPGTFGGTDPCEDDGVPRGRDEGRKDDAKKDSSKKDDGKKDVAKKDDGKKDDAKKDNGKKDSSKKDDAKKDDGKKDDGKKDNGRKDDGKKDDAKKDNGKKDSSKKDDAKKDDGKKDDGKKDNGRKDDGKPGADKPGTSTRTQDGLSRTWQNRSNDHTRVRDDLSNDTQQGIPVRDVPPEIDKPKPPGGDPPKPNDNGTNPNDPVTGKDGRGIETPGSVAGLRDRHEIPGVFEPPPSVRPSE